MSQSQHELWRYQPPYGTMIDLQVYAKWPDKIKRAYWGLPPEDEVREESAAVLNFREKVRKAGPLDEVQIPVWMSVSDGVRIIQEERERQRRAERDEQLLVMAGVKQPGLDLPEFTGGSVSYYAVRVKQPVSGGEPYTAECLDIIEALGMDYAEGNAFKAIWRRCAARMDKLKKGYDDGLYDAEKTEFYGRRMVEISKRRRENSA